MYRNIDFEAKIIRVKRSITEVRYQHLKQKKVLRVFLSLMIY